MFCIRCAQELPDTAQFCLRCGLPVPVMPPASHSVAVEPSAAGDVGETSKPDRRKQMNIGIFVAGFIVSLFGWWFGLIVVLVLLVRSTKDLSLEGEAKSALALYLGVGLLMMDSMLWFVMR
jgi:hypothetical protein